MVNLSCLMVSCTNFLRATCPYIECQLSFPVDPKPYGIHSWRLQLLFLLDYLLTWLVPHSTDSVDATLCLPLIDLVLTRIICISKLMKENFSFLLNSQWVSISLTVKDFVSLSIQFVFPTISLYSYIFITEFTWLCTLFDLLFLSFLIMPYLNFQSHRIFDCWYIYIYICNICFNINKI